MSETNGTVLAEVSKTPQVSPELLVELHEANERFHKALVGYNLASEISKGKKKILEMAQTALNEVCDEITRGATSLPLFDSADVATDPEAWREVRLDSLANPGIPQATLRALSDHEIKIETMGQLAHRQEVDGDWWAKKIKGLGEAGQVAIDEATTAYWEDHPQVEEPVTDDLTDDQN